MTTNGGKLSAIALTLALGLSLLPALAPPPVQPSQGAIFTTDVNGIPVNANLYDAKCDVYLNGGPNGPGGPSLPDGVWYFQVTNPSGSMLLSTDAIGERSFLVSGGVIVAYLGTTHGWNDIPGPSIVIQLCPFDDTDNPGGEYKVWASMDPTFPNSESKTDNFKVKPQQANLPPTACIVDPTYNEGDLVTLDGTCSSDADGSIVSYVWDFDILVDTSGDGIPDNDTDATGNVTSFTWYDDYVATVQLTVTDDDGATDSVTKDFTILNVPPEITEGPEAFIEAVLRCRVAGSKWSNVLCRLGTDYDPDTDTFGDLLASTEIERWPGSPDDNPYVGTGSVPVLVPITGGEELTAVVTYDPYPDSGDAILGDQPNNGNDPFDNAGNPVWLIIETPDGTELCRHHHTFNTQQSEIRDSEHWNHVDPWITEFSIQPAVGVPITVVTTASDPGTDDLTFTVDWGDATATANTYFYDGVGADVAYPPGSPYEPYGLPWDASGPGPVPPIVVTDSQTHAYAAPGTYTITVIVTDDDGGASSVAFDITIAAETACVDP